MEVWPTTSLAVLIGSFGTENPLPRAANGRDESAYFYEVLGFSPDRKGAASLTLNLNMRICMSGKFE